jgi:hypothetical protein
MKHQVNELTVAWLAISGGWRSLVPPEGKVFRDEGVEALTCGEHLVERSILLGSALQRGIRAESDLRKCKEELLRLRRDSSESLRRSSSDRLQLERALEAEAREGSRVKGLLVLEINQLNEELTHAQQRSEIDLIEKDKLNSLIDFQTKLIMDQEALLEEICSARGWRLLNRIRRILGRA